MPTVKQPYKINEATQQQVAKYFFSAVGLVNNQWQIRSTLQYLDREYQRTNDFTIENQKAMIANSYGDKTKMQNFTVPVVLNQVESAVAYLSEVFLTGLPIFGVVSGPKNADQAMAMDTLMLNHSLYGGWVREFQMFFRDGQKYNLAALEVDWHEEKIYTPETLNNVSTAMKETVWAGNKIKRLDLYNTFWDTRVAPADVARIGEFAGYTDLMARIAFRAFVYSLPGISSSKIKEALESGTSMGRSMTYYIPEINPLALLNVNPRATTDWFAWAGIDMKVKIKYNNMYEVTTMYIRMIPSEFGMDVPAPNTVQIWKFIVVNGSVVVYAERQSNAHNMLPIIFSQPNEDGLRYQTKSTAQNMVNIQDLASAMVNATIEGKRRAVMDRIYYDPSRIRAADINSKNVVARIPVRASSYGKPISDAVYTSPYNDQQSVGLMQEAMQFVQFGNVITGSNGPQQGQFQKGNKTLHEYQDTMEHSNSRYRMAAQFIEAQVMQPLKMMLKLNILQYQESGTYYNPALNKTVEINSIDLRTAALEFKVSDGLTPADRLIGADEMQVALQIIGASPELQVEFDITSMWVWWLEQRGAKELQQFKRTPEQQQQKMAQMQAITDSQTPTADKQQAAAAQQEAQASQQAAATGG